MPSPIGPRLVTIPTTTPAEASTGPEAPATPATTPARAPVCEEPELISRVETSAGALAALAMKPTWNAGAESARATGAEGGPGYDGPMPARPLRPLEEKVAQKAGEAWKAASESGCEQIVKQSVKYIGSKLPYVGPLAPLVAPTVASKLCNNPAADGTGYQGGGAHGSSGVER